MVQFDGLPLDAFKTYHLRMDPKATNPQDRPFIETIKLLLHCLFFSLQQSK